MRFGADESPWRPARRPTTLGPTLMYEEGWLLDYEWTDQDWDEGHGVVIRGKLATRGLALYYTTDGWMTDSQIRGKF